MDDSEPAKTINTSALLRKKYPRVIAWLENNTLPPPIHDLKKYLVDAFGGIDPLDTPVDHQWGTRIALAIVSSLDNPLLIQ